MPENDRSMAIQSEINREQQAKQLLAFMDRVHAADVFRDAASKKKFIESLTFDDFKSWLTRANAELRNIPKAVGAMDGGNVRIQLESKMIVGGSMMGYDPPHPDDKDELLKKMFDRAKSMNDINDVALLIASCINAIHPFKDGNGRSSRLTYSLLHDGYNGSKDDVERLAKLLGDEGRKQVDVNPEKIAVLVNYVYAADELGKSTDSSFPTNCYSSTSPIVGSLEIDTLPINNPIDKADLQKLIDLYDEKTAGVFVFYAFLKKHDKLKEPYLKHHAASAEMRLPERTTIQVDEVFKELTQTEVDEILNIKREYKKKFVELLIEMFSNPDEYKIRGMTVKDIFQKMVSDNISSIEKAIRSTK